MPVVTEEIRLETKGEVEMIDITERVAQSVRQSGLKDGAVTIFVPGSTAAVTTIEHEPGLLRDFPNMLERVVPKGIRYWHEETWHDGNGHAHVRASLLGPSLTVPFRKGRLTLGTWQQIVFVELDIRSRERSVVLQIMGE